MKLIELRETAPWGAFDLSVDEVQVLQTSGLVDVRPDPAIARRWQLRASGNVGAAVLHSGTASVDLRISPKIEVSRLLFLMGYAQSPEAWRSDWVDLPKAHDLPAAIGEALARSVGRALTHGLLQGYRSIDEAGLTVRGRIRHGDQMRRHFGQVLPLEVTYDEYTVDIAENQILKAAVNRMLKVPGVTGLTRRRLKLLTHRLAEVSDLVAGQRLPTWQPNRLNARYVPALHLAELIWRGSSFDLARGTVRASGFMVRMWSVFEAFTTTALGEALCSLNGGRMVTTKDRVWKLDVDAQVNLYPDLVWYPNRLGGAPGIVVDAKYKAEKPDGFPNADVYQLLAYCTSLGLNRGYLLYAAGNESGATYEIRGAGPGGNGVTVQARTIDLASRPGELLAQIRDLAVTMLAAQEPTPVLQSSQPHSAVSRNAISTTLWSVQDDGAPGLRRTDGLPALIVAVSDRPEY